MMRLGIAAVMIAAGVLLAGYSQGAFLGENPPRERSYETSALERTAESTVLPKSDAEPPGGTLGFGDRTVAGVLGSYCWSSGSSASCVDGAYPLVPGEEKILAVPADSDMVFDYGGEAPPDAVRAGAELLVPDGEPNGSSSRPLVTDGSGGRVTIPAGLPAGDYVVDVSVRVPEGDASYYFRVVVEGGVAALPGAGGPEDRSGELPSERKSL